MNRLSSVYDLTLDEVTEAFVSVSREHPRVSKELLKDTAVKMAEELYEPII